MRIAAAGFLLSIATTVGLSAVPAQAHDKIGANLNFIGDFRRNHEFVDLVKQSRMFLKIGQFDDQQAANLAPIGADGWPTTDFRLFAMAAQQATQNLAGTYKIVFNGQATLSMAAGGAGTVSNKVYDTGTNTTTADLVFPAGAENFLVDFTGTGGTVKNVRILRPGHAATSTQLLHTPWKDHAKRFPVLRFLDWTRTNGNRDITWADRVTPEKRRTEAYIASWETVIDAANALNRDAWINVPVQANDEYVTNLATLIRDRLNPNLNVYVEYGNELWNFNIRDVDMDNINGGAFNGATVNRDLAVASPPASPLRFDGQTDPTTLGFRRIALRLKEISDIFRTVWGSPAINTRVRPVLAGQMANSFIVSEGLDVIDNPLALNVRPSSVFYAISGAPYIFPAAIPDGTADETPGMTVQQILDGLAAGVANAPSDSNAYQYLTHAGLGAWYGLKVVAYEAGFDNFGSQNVANKRLANLDPQIRTICTNLINQWHGFGFEHILWFNAGADSYNSQFGMWPLVEDMAVQATPKNQCIDDVLAAALPAVTAGTSVTGGAIAGGNYRGSTNTAGAVSGLDGPFGFPGFVEYLLRTEVEGTYDIQFTGNVPSGESFRLELNNALVAANVTSLASPVRVTLRRGLNAMRIKRGNGASFSITSFTFTLVGDGTPDAFSFTAQTNVAAGTTVVSNAATITGLTIAANVSVSGGEYSAGCTGTFTSAPATITNNQTVCLRHTAANAASTVTTTTLTIGGVSGSFSSTTAASVTPSNPVASLSASSIEFGGQSMGTTSASRTVTVTNVGGSTLTISAVSVSSAQFAQTNNCTSVAPTATCTITVTFSPAPVASAALNATTAVSATLSITSNGTGSPQALDLTGTAEKSLITHFYRGILNRAPEPGGKEFWEGEAARLSALGANVNEIWFVMANYFFNSSEYLGANKTATAFLVDVYNTFFNRPPDQAGFDFWMSQMNAGLSREGVIFWFMFSAEFSAFSQAIFGNTAARPEVDMVMDLFRGLLNRFPDTAGFNSFVGSLRTAQCQGANAPGAVYAKVHEISFFFLFGSSEYASRARDNTQFVSDMYNAFLRRGGVASEVGFWIDQLNTGAKDHNRERADFIDTPEFGARVNAVINAGCLQ